MKNKTTYGLKSEKLTELLRIGANEEDDFQDNIEQSKTNKLWDLLSESIPLDSDGSKPLNPLLKHLCQELLPYSGQSQSELLLNPGTDLTIISKIKNYHKFLSASTDREVEKEVSAAIYYTAIAAAITYYDKNISKHTYTQLAKYFSVLESRKWVIKDIAELLTKAKNICQDMEGI